MRKVKPSQQGRKIPSRRAICRSVASSTAIETGQSIRQLEKTLRSSRGKFGHIKLAS